VETEAFFFVFFIHIPYWTIPSCLLLLTIHFFVLIFAKVNDEMKERKKVSFIRAIHFVFFSLEEQQQQKQP
jgi:hypothetical protein